MAHAANENDAVGAKNNKAQLKARNELEVRNVVKQIKKLLAQIEDAVPLINLAITTSGASLSTSLPPTVSPSRLLQASTFVTTGDREYCLSSARKVQIGPTFTLSLYMLFSGHLRPESEEEIRQSTWKEVIHKARLKLVRVPLSRLDKLPNETLQQDPDDFGRSDRANIDRQHIAGEDRADEFGYQIIIIEDLDDGRFHENEDDEPQPGPYDGVGLAGIREAIPIHEVSKIFYADTGKILNIGSGGDTNSPVLLLKRDINAIPPRRLSQRYSEDQEETTQDHSHRLYESTTRRRGEDYQTLIDAQLVQDQRVSSASPTEAAVSIGEPNSWRLPHNLDPEWLAFEVFTDPVDSDDDSEFDTHTESSLKSARARTASLIPQMTSELSNLHVSNVSDSNLTLPGQLQLASTPTTHAPSMPVVRTSLSLLEMILRLLSLQQFQQTSHLVIPDEFLNFFLAESATTGAASGDERERRRLRNDARRKVGFDPYDESPMKRRGEDYQYRGGQSQAGWNEDAIDDAGHEFSPRQQVYNGYSSPRWDEGYETHQVYSPSHSNAYAGQVANPETPLLLKDHPQSFRSPAPGGRMPSLPRSGSSENTPNGLPSPSTPSNGFGVNERIGHLRHANVGRKERWGSPLARPTTDMTDEGLGTSPSAVLESLEKD
ncbi:hypothetical protein MMC26_001682 [Xylographa opegraphella]|nr:hypothetical protein [Xylographa opegraphella]